MTIIGIIIIALLTIIVMIQLLGKNATIGFLMLAIALLIYLAVSVVIFCLYVLCAPEAVATGAGFAGVILISLMIPSYATYGLVKLVNR